MNFRVIFRVLSFTMLALVLAFLLCSLSDVFIFHNKCNQLAWLHCIEIATAMTLLLFILSLRYKLEFFRREALAIVGLSWVLVSIFGALPYIFIHHASFYDALFESSSGITTTGFSVFQRPEELSQGLLLWRALSQWIGGLGISVFFVIITASMGTTAKQMFSNESSCNIADFDSGKIKNNALLLVKIYLSLTLSCFIFLWIFGMSFYDAICHTFATVATGGFSTHANSLAYFNSTFLDFITTIFMALGGTNFIIFVCLFNRSYSKIRENEELKIYYSILILSGSVIACLIYFQDLGFSLVDAIFKGFFHATSAMTSCGFSSCNLSNWVPVTHFILISLMACGGCTGSTAGGMKIARLVIIYKEISNTLVNTFRPRLVQNVYFNGKIIEKDGRKNAVDFCVLCFFLALFFILIFIAVEPNLDFSSAISTVIALFSNAGLSVSTSDITPSSFCNFTKIVASLIMVLGRIELYSVLLLFVPSFWKRY